MPHLPQLLDETNRSKSTSPALEGQDGMPQGLYPKCGKRILDIVLSAAGFVLTASIFALVSVCIKATSRRLGILWAEARWKGWSSISTYEFSFNGYPGFGSRTPGT